MSEGARTGAQKGSMGGSRVPGRTRLETIWWDIGRCFCETVLKIFYRLRVIGRERIPETGPVLFICNHQSYLDPLINGCAVRRRQFTAIAQEGLFRFAPLGLLLRSYGCIAISRETGDAGALKAALAELEAGRCVLVYPEGTRSPDGEMKSFRRGILLLQRRARVPVVPMGLDGSFEIWPRDRKRPRWSGGLRVEVGDPIPSERLEALNAEEAVRLLASEVDRLRLRARAALRRERGGLRPPSGPGDAPAASERPVEERV